MWRSGQYATRRFLSFQPFAQPSSTAVIRPPASFIVYFTTSSSMYYYAVKQGRKPGIYTTWDECKQQVNGFGGAVYKKFPSPLLAQQFIDGSTPPIVAAVDISNSSGTSASTTKAISTTAAIVSIINKTSTSNPVFPNRGGTQQVHVYCDGSSLGNGHLGAKAGYGVWFQDPQFESLNEGLRLPGSNQSNNRAEVMALIRAIQLNPNPEAKLVLFTDSQYAINTVTKWIRGWKRNDWRTSNGLVVQNQGLIKRLDDLIHSSRIPPQFIYVKGHSGNHGNEMADQLAKHGASLPETKVDRSLDSLVNPTSCHQQVGSTSQEKQEESQTKRKQISPPSSFSSSPSSSLPNNGDLKPIKRRKLAKRAKLVASEFEGLQPEDLILHPDEVEALERED